MSCMTLKKELCDKVPLATEKKPWEELPLTWLTASPKLIFTVGFPSIWFSDGYSVTFWELTFSNLGWLLSHGSTKCSISASVNSLHENKNKTSLTVTVVFWLVNWRHRIDLFSLGRLFSHYGPGWHSKHLLTPIKVVITGRILPQDTTPWSQTIWSGDKSEH